MSFLMLAAYSTGSAFSAALGMYGGSISTGSSRRRRSSVKKPCCGSNMLEKCMIASVIMQSARNYHSPTRDSVLEGAGMQ
jgi:hypothetical protein